MIKLLTLSLILNAQTFVFKDLAGREFSVKAVNHKLAARTCFQHLTGGTYQGEEKSLDIIDRCANPVKVIK
jgi:hypothetical protein